MERLFKEIEEKLLNYPRFRKSPEFRTVNYILKIMGYKDTVPIIHIVGTNGKGSVLTMLDQILRKKSVKTGTFTSPHLLDIRERIGVDGRQISKEAFINSYQAVETLVKCAREAGYAPPTFFEWLFLMAIHYWMDQQIDVLIIEAGIGGGKDTTNVLTNKLLTVITRIGWDHEQVLGHSIKEIAGEKGGAIRAGVPVVFYNERKEVCDEIERQCYKKSAKLYQVLPSGIKINKRNKESIDFSIRNKYYEDKRLLLPTQAKYQLENVAICIRCVTVLAEKFKLDKKAVRDGLAEFDWPGRMSYINNNILLDGAHNTDGIRAFVEHINTVEGNKSIEIIYASQSDKEYEKMLEILLGITHLKKIYLPVTSFLDITEVNIFKKVLEKRKFKHAVVVKELKSLIRKVMQHGAETTLFGCVGSLYLVSEIQKNLKEDLHD